jgi:hypothetical protein
MRIFLFTTVLLFAHILVMPQSANKVKQIEQVQAAVGSLVSKHENAEIMLRDLSELEGFVTTLSEDSFGLKVKMANGKRVTAEVAYENVLVIKSKKVSISFITDPTSRALGSWDDVLKISYNNSLEVVLENGQSVTGRTGEITKAKLTLFNFTDNEKLLLSPDQIVAVYRVRRPSGKNGDAIAGSSIEGGKIGREIGTTATGKVVAGSLGTIVGAGVGAVSEVAKNEEKLLRVLIYSN